MISTWFYSFLESVSRFPYSISKHRWISDHSMIDLDVGCEVRRMRSWKIIQILIIRQNQWFLPALSAFLLVFSASLSYCISASGHLLHNLHIAHLSISLLLANRLAPTKDGQILFETPINSGKVWTFMQNCIELSRNMKTQMRKINEDQLFLATPVNFL